MKHILAFVMVVSALMPVAAKQPASKDGAVFVAYYWRARVGKEDEYNDYIRNTAERIDESPRQPGASEEVCTVTPAPGTVTDLLHLRILRLKNAAAEQAL